MGMGGRERGLAVVKMRKIYFEIVVVVKKRRKILHIAHITQRATS
jgi:hypothetical protein